MSPGGTVSTLTGFTAMCSWAPGTLADATLCAPVALVQHPSGDIWFVVRNDRLRWVDAHCHPVLPCF